MLEEPLHVEPAFGRDLELLDGDPVFVARRTLEPRGAEAPLRAEIAAFLARVNSPYPCGGPRRL